MRSLIILFAAILLFSCKKESLKNDENYKRFIGAWESIDKTEEVSVFFNSNGKIVLKNSIERLFYSPNTVFIDDSNIKTNGIFWKRMSFNIYKDSEAIYSGPNFIINKNNDSLYLQYKNIENFVAQPTYSTLLIKKK